MTDKRGIRFIQSKMSQVKANRRKRYLALQKTYRKKLKRYAPDILASPNFQSTKNHIQHGTMTVNDHCMNVAKYSMGINRRLHLNCNEKELVRGALLHDYFLYDWHDKGHVELTNLHGFHHPRIALENAMKEYKLTPREQDIVRKHMWPLTVVPPRCREAWVVTMADKWCSSLETLRLHKGNGVRKDGRVLVREAK